MKIIFMGTPDFAVASLAILHENGYEIAAVITVPDKPVGRGLKLGSSPVKNYALAHNLPIFQPEKLKDPEFIAALEKIQPDLAVVVAFRMLPEVVWRIPKLGTFNLHASLLPNYRGAAPINWAVANGETVSGVTTFFIDKQIDTGELLFQERVEIPAEWNAGDLHDALMEVGSKLVLKTVQAIEKGDIHPIPQDNSQVLHHAPKIFKEHCKIDWNKPAETVHNLVRGMSPFPTAFTIWDNKMLKIYETKLTNDKCSSSVVGTIWVNEKKTILRIACKDKWLEILSVQPESKKRMSAGDFIRGLHEVPVQVEI